MNYGQYKKQNGARAMAGGDNGYRPKMKINYSDDRPNQKRARIEEPVMQGVKKRNNYNWWKRFAVGVFAVGTAAGGVYLSREFFGIDQPESGWIGIFLGLFFLVLETVINFGGVKNPVLIVGAVVSYVFSIGANIEVLNRLMPHLADEWVIKFLGSAIELVPEPLFVYAVLGDDAPNPFSGLWAWLKKGLVRR